MEAPRTIGPGDPPGWSGEEWAEHLREEMPPVQLPPPVAGVVLFAPHASELALAPLARALAHLERGERVRLVVPEALPALGEVWSGALAGRSGWQCIQDDGLGVLRAALVEPGVGAFEASAPPARAAQLAQLYGRGTITILRNTSLVVRREDDAEELAHSAARRAFGRVAALSGQRAGALGRVVCHERSFSRFSAALLAELERLPDFAQPVPLLERASRAHVAHARPLGLDEGATLVLSRKDPPACVFTNVDERLRLATLARCAGLLVLLRAASDEEGAALAARLDGDARAEDLG